ncbi:transposase [Arcicella aurantiaca]|jgi:transposase|uniref:Transposase n=1 Tax=Arcicella aurantiaca TaxID=591202 RepID=A0A316DH18_9BACT|nr:IS110 family transposase [Arcicella aurantiaca]PWK17175.1 transposase [Arcicella aurantiaca]
MAKYAVGLDISSKKINACLSFIDDVQMVKVISSKVINNTKKGFEELIVWIKKHKKDEKYQLIIGMEATGVYYEECAYYLFEQNFSVVVVLPNKAKKYMQAMGVKSKNDIIDAKSLAQMFAERHFKLWQPMGKFFYILRSMTRHQEALKSIKNVFSNQLHALKRGVYVDKTIVKQIQKQIDLTDKQITAIEAKISLHIKSDPEVEKKVTNIAFIKGVGILTIAVLIAETNGFILFENASQLVSYAGYDVVENQSGKHTGKTRISKKGNSHIRRILHLPAFCVVRNKVAPFENLYKRTFENHKVKMKSYVAVQKKLLVIIYALWKNEVEFEKDFLKTNTREVKLDFPSLVNLSLAS